MRRILIAAAVAATTLTPSFAQAHTTALETKYNGLYAQVSKKFGHREPGRQIVKWGIKTHKGVRDPSQAEVRNSLQVLDRTLHPPPVPKVAPPVSPTVPSTTSYSTSTPSYSAPSYSAPATSTSTGGCTAIPSFISQRESGCDYSAVNPFSGARGAYQMMPSTYAAVCGTCDWSPADQDQAASKLWDQYGYGPWSGGG